MSYLPLTFTDGKKFDHGPTSRSTTRPPIPPKIIAAIQRMIDEQQWGTIEISFQDGEPVFLKVTESTRLGSGRKP